MTKTLEDRVAELERYRAAASGRINALQHLLLTLFLDGLLKAPKPFEALSRFREAWLKQSETMDGEWGEYTKAVRDICERLEEEMRIRERRMN